MYMCVCVYIYVCIYIFVYIYMKPFLLVSIKLCKMSPQPAKIRLDMKYREYISFKKAKLFQEELKNISIS